MTDFPLSVARALAEANYMGAKEYIMEHGEVPATADPVGTDDIYGLMVKGTKSAAVISRLQDQLSAAIVERDTVRTDLNDRIAALVAENERLRSALKQCQRTLAILIDPQNKGSGIDNMAAWASCVASESRARAALGEQP